jgi:glutamine amidotransferase
MIAIIDYDAGNLTSVARAVTYLGFSCVITRDPAQIAAAERIIFPGVGAAGSAMASLKALGLDAAIRQAFDQLKPILGICLGTQIILSRSDENQTICLGIIDGTVRSFPADLSIDGQRLKIPHMGWNRIQPTAAHPILNGVKDSDEFYFVHGYYPDPANFAQVLCTTDYGLRFASVIRHKNVVATQFHPEKSGRPGLRLLKNFCLWNP